MDELLLNFFNFDIYREVFPFLLQGLYRTVELSLLVIPTGIVAGLLIAVVLTESRSRWIRWPLIVYIDIFRAFPPLPLLIFIYFGFPFVGLEIPKLVAVAIGFLLNNSSYYAEIFRSGIEVLPKGQTEAARSTGLTRGQTLAYVVIPQVTRNTLPDLMSNSIEIIKLTSIASVVAMPELLRAARDAQNLLYNPSPIVLAALMYLAIIWPLVRWMSYLESKSLRRTRPDPKVA